MFDLDGAIRRVCDFPKPGIVFYDITSILTNPDAFRHCMERTEEIYASKQFDAVAAVESRGFVFAAPFALKRGLPLILIRKKGKLPGPTLRVEITLEYGTDTLEAHREDVPSGGNILLMDDLVATGGSLRGAAELMARAGARVHDVFSVIGLPFLGYAERLSGFDVSTLIEFEGE